MSDFFQKPLRITAPMARSFWTELRAMGFLDSIQGKPIEVISIKWSDPGPNADYLIHDASQSQSTLDEGATGPDFVGGDLQYVFAPGVKRWRDWQVSQLSGGELIIDYR